MTSPRDQSHEPAWQAFLTRQCARTPIEGTVASIVPFGAFIELGEGVHGLLHRSEWTAEPSVGSTISVRVLQLDLATRRVSLAPA